MMSSAVARTKTEVLQDLVDQYRKAEHGGALDLAEVSHWLLRRNLWSVDKGSASKILRGELARALREEYISDPQGRRVRRNHAYRVSQGHEQQIFWVDMYEATPEQMRLAFQQRRRGILGDCKQLKNDVDSFNENNSHGAHIQMTFDFGEDLLEAQMPTTYPEAKPEDI